MVRIDLTTAAFAVLSVAVGAHSISDVTAPAWIQWLQRRDMIEDGKVVVPFENYCSVKDSPACMALHEIADSVHAAESALFCDHVNCTNQLSAEFNSSIGTCQCPTLNERDYFPNANCDYLKSCEAPLAPYFDPDIQHCLCSFPIFPAGGYPVRFEPNDLKEQFYGPTKAKLRIPEIADDVSRTRDEMTFGYQLSRHFLEPKHTFHMRSTYRRHQYIKTVIERTRAEQSRRVGKFNAIMEKLLADDVQPTPSGAVSLAPLPTYIPPPNIQVTDELIQESLVIQPQQVATVASVVPHFADGVITFFIQLDGPISQTLTLNATDSLPCESIGAEPQPILMLVPNTVKNGTAQAILPDCLVLAVNTYNPKYVTYWIQKEDGSVFSLLSDNQVHAIDQLDTSQPASLAIRVAPAGNDRKRNIDPTAPVAGFKRTQIFPISCGSLCPFYHMQYVGGSGEYCGCIFKGADQQLDVVHRGVEQPTPYTAIMTANACAAMTCLNNGGKPALFNPFTSTCWCASPTYVETNDNAYDGGL